MDLTDSYTMRILFVASTSSSLSSSPFVDYLGCSGTVAESTQPPMSHLLFSGINCILHSDFRSQTRALYEELLDRWRSRVSSMAAVKYRSTCLTTDVKQTVGGEFV